MKTNMMVENVKMKNKTLMSLMLILMFMMMLILMPSRVRAVTKYSHTSNISDAGVQNGDYAPNLATKDVVTIPGASSLKVTVTYGTESNYDMLYIFQGEYTGSVTKNMSAGQLYTLQGGNSSTTTVEYEIQGDTVTFAFYSDSNVSYYGYYATIENIAFYTIGSNRYKTLKEAIDSVASGGTATIVVNEDTMDSSNAVIPSGKTITLNTNGKTIIKNDYSITNNGNLTITGGGKKLTDAVYTVTLNNNGGTGGTLSVVATLNDDMPNIASLPTRAGTGTPGFHGDISSIGNEVLYGDGSYKFEGYFDASTGGTKYYNADGTSARAWDKETNATLYAHWKLVDESFYVAGFKNGKVQLLTKYMVKPSTLEQSTDIVNGTDTLAFSSTNYWSSSNPTYPYNLTTNTPASNITASNTPALYYAKQYGAKYGVNGTLLTKEEVDTICGRTSSNNYFNSYDSGVTWPDWLTSPYYSNGSRGGFWLGSAQNSESVWAVETSTYGSTVGNNYFDARKGGDRPSSSYRSANI